ncbi:uncharacterized protein LOC110447320 [Mizuhopecten yessoensis]|uniref:uncharacterized protein LOC110447320 n=1 Tax=Mizuhopecten yessoensis TaxID=6573 RepID=UPI000B45F1EF|nr:uncharacterized protein LOC110447320 [Mizuhopecten yessoensis]
MIQRQHYMMDRRLFIAVLVMYILIGRGDGKVCPVSRAKLNPTLYRNATCPGECCFDLSFKFCCDAIDDVNEPVVIAFCVIVGVVIIAVVFIICCCYESKKKKVPEPEEIDEEDDAGQNGDQYIYPSRVGLDHHGYMYPSPRGNPPHHVKY